MSFMTSVDGTHDRSLGEATAALPEVRQARMRLRALLLKSAFATSVLIALSYALYEWWAASAIVSTDDAYVGAVFAQVTPQVDGTVRSIQVYDTQHVHEGDLLLTLDPKDAQLDLDAARAFYKGAYQRAEQQAADTDVAQANVLAKRSLVSQAEQQLRRRAGIGRIGVVAAEEVSNARSALDAAKYALSVAEHQLTAKRVVAGREAIESNPEIQEASINLRRSELKLERTYIRAPVDGIVAQLSGQIGQKIAAGTELMTIVPIGQLFVDANFKESQITEIRPGQFVTLKSDIYGSGRTFHGYVQGVGGGTGATFAIIPPQNATGNWIKVVQRVPVRIALDPRELVDNPLRAGISMSAEIHLDRSFGVPRPYEQSSDSFGRKNLALRADASGSY
jgi:membrane fusion protein (multidrug efflux system)